MTAALHTWFKFITKWRIWGICGFLGYCTV